MIWETKIFWACLFYLLFIVNEDYNFIFTYLRINTTKNVKNVTNFIPLFVFMKELVDSL